MKSWQTIAACVFCGIEKIKRKDEIPCSGYKCFICARKQRGKELGNNYGKNQEYQGNCKGCGVSQNTRLRWCHNCKDKKRKTFSERMSGSNNPVWTGNSMCECGDKKSVTAKQCRSCSFASGSRSGNNNGRYITENRGYMLQCRKSQNTLSGLMHNVCKSMGIQKNRQKTVDLLGYSWREFKRHIESHFKEGMSWNNHGKWHIDHIVPVDWFIKNNIFDLKIVNSLKNLQPLWATDNLRKSNKINEKDEAAILRVLDSQQEDDR